MKIKRLKERKLEKYKDYATKLAKEGSDKSINKLERGIEFSNNIDKIKINIEALSYTKNKDVLEFLKKISLSKTESRIDHIPPHLEFFGSEAYEDPGYDKEYTATFYPNASKKLKNILVPPYTWNSERICSAFKKSIERLEKELVE